MILVQTLSQKWLRTLKYARLGCFLIIYSVVSNTGPKLIQSQPTLFSGQTHSLCKSSQTGLFAHGQAIYTQRFCSALGTC